jgi:hypothetical protein
MTDWFTSRFRLDYKNENLAENPHLEYLRRLEGKIMMFVIAAQDGIGHLELASKVGINRKNLTPHMRRLIVKGLVIRGRGKRGKYCPASKKYRGMSVTADIFSKAAACTIFEEDRNLPIDSPCFDGRIIDDNPPLDNALFTFSNGVGAILTYMLVQSMNPSNEIPGRDVMNDEEKDINVYRWFNDRMSSLGDLMLALFKEHIRSELTLSCNNYFNQDGTVDLYRAGMDTHKFYFTKPLFTLDEKSIDCLMTSFRKIYPGICAHLEEISSRIPSAVSRENSRVQYQRISHRQQNICKHDFRLPTNKTLSERYQNSILHCSKCHKNKYIMELYKKLFHRTKF